MSGGPSLGVEQRRAGDERIEVVVAVVDRHLELHPRARRRPVERHAGERDVALEHRRVHLARGVAELVEVVVVDVVLVLDRRVVLGRDEPRLVVDPVVVAPVDDQPAQLPARRPAGQLAPDRVAADELAIGGRDVADHPAEPELDRGRPIVVGPGEAARMEVDIEEDETGLDAGHVQRGHPDRDHALAPAALPHRVPDGQRVGGRDPQLEPEVAGEAGPRDEDGHLGDGRRGDPEVGEVRDGLRQRGEDVARPWALDREHRPGGRHVLDPDVETADETLEIGEVRLGRGQDELVVGEPQDDPVLDDEAAIVAPGRVLRVTRSACPDVASEDAGQEALGVWPVDPVLVERRRVEQAGGIADREVLELVRHLVANRGQVVRPVLPQPGLVERARPLVEGRRPDHAADDTRGIPSRADSVPPGRADRSSGATRRARRQGTCRRAVASGCEALPGRILSTGPRCRSGTTRHRIPEGRRLRHRPSLGTEQGRNDDSVVGRPPLRRPVRRCCPCARVRISTSAPLPSTGRGGRIHAWSGFAGS